MPPARRKPPARPSRAAASKARSPAKGGRKGGGKGGQKGRGGGGSWGKRLGRWLLTWTSAVAVGGGGGVATVVYLLYRQALVDVETALEGPVWQASGAVLSGPMEIWPGLALSPEALAEDLVAAGYSRVEKASRPGDVQVAARDVLVHVPAWEGAGVKVPAGEVHLSFSGGVVSAVSPRQRAVFAPVKLSEIRGPGNESRSPVALKDLPPHVPQALLAMEDARFYSHEGLDPVGILRAVLINSLTDRPMQGGSTLTQQLVKNLFLTQERSLERKGREALLAIAIEQTRSKDEILELYLNEIYLGEAGGASICGIDQAARAYFGTSAERLTVGEAATLAGVVSAPNRYSPLRHPEEAQARRDLVLDRMVEVGQLDPHAADAAKASPLVVRANATGRRAPWVVDAALEAVEGGLGEGSVAARGVTIHTTLQPALQRLAEQVVADSIAALEKEHPEAKGAQMALVAVRVSDGAVVAMVGGRDYGESQFNRALHGRRQVGSTIKPLTYLGAFEADPTLSPASTLLDAPLSRVVDGKTWEPHNYDGRYVGEITLRRALATSRNIPAVLMSEEVGMGGLQKLWLNLGLSGATRNPAAALGSFEATPVELAGAYTVFPGAGRWARPTVVRRAVDLDGKLLWNEDAVVIRRTSDRAAFLGTRLLQAVVEEGTGRKASTHGATGALGGKTGTTDNERDAWFVGVTPELAIAVWVGFDRGRSVKLTGSEAALPAWSRFVAGSGTSGGAFPVPKGLVLATLCTESNQPAEPACPETWTEYYTEGTVPLAGCRLHGGPLDNAADALTSAWERVKARMGGNDKEAPAVEEPSRRRLFGRKR